MVKICSYNLERSSASFCKPSLSLSSGTLDEIHSCTLHIYVEVQTQGCREVLNITMLAEEVYSRKFLIPITYFFIQRCKNYCQLLCPADIYKMHGILEINFSRYMDFGKSKILNICGIEFCTQSIVYYLFNCHLQIIWCDGCILKIVRSCNLLFKNLGFYTLNVYYKKNYNTLWL